MVHTALEDDVRAREGKEIGNFTLPLTIRERLSFLGENKCTYMCICVKTQMCVINALIYTRLRYN